MTNNDFNRLSSFVGLWEQIGGFVLEVKGMSVCK